jgi:asparagine synthetase B (glutamine-hydrolysing)
MYAFAIVDGDKAILARDPWGIKPLHYTVLRNGRALAFASEIKALLRCPEVRAEIDDATLGDLRTLEYVADPTATLFKDIRCLEPGYCLEIDLADATLMRRGHCFCRRSNASTLPQRPRKRRRASTSCSKPRCDRIRWRTFPSA